MLKSWPLVRLPGSMGGAQRHTTPEWTTPGPSLIVGVPAVQTPLTQWISSMMKALKLATRRFGVMVKLAGLMAAGSVLTIMSHPLNGAILATLTW